MTKVNAEILRTAEFSDDGRCRWNLKRIWEPKKGLALYVGLNPSRADAKVDDMTVKKGIGFAESWGYGGTMHGNAYPFITPYPQDLAQCTYEEMEKNDAKLVEMARLASVVVLAWGSFPKFKARFDCLAELLKRWRPICLGLTKDGFPHHISRIAYSTRREAYFIDAMDLFESHVSSDSSKEGK